MQQAYNGTVQSTIETRKFLASNDERALFLKNEVTSCSSLENAKNIILRDEHLLTFEVGEVQMNVLAFRFFSS